MGEEAIRHCLSKCDNGLIRNSFDFGGHNLRLKLEDILCPRFEHADYVWRAPLSTEAATAYGRSESNFVIFLKPFSKTVVKILFSKSFKAGRLRFNGHSNGRCFLLARNGVFCPNKLVQLVGSSRNLSNLVCPSCQKIVDSTVNAVVRGVFGVGFNRAEEIRPTNSRGIRF